MPFIRSTWLIHALAAFTCIAAQAAPGQRVATSTPRVLAEKSPKVRSGPRGGSGKTLETSSRGRRKVTSKATNEDTIVSRLQRELKEIQDAHRELQSALTSHKVASIAAPPKGKSVKHRVFTRLNGRGTLPLEGAEHGDIFSIDGEWHTIDTKTAEWMRENNTMFVESEWADTGNIIPEALPLRYRFGLPIGMKRSSIAFRAEAMSSTEYATSEKTREMMEFYSKPSVRIFKTEPGFSNVTIRRVGKVMAERLFRGSTQPLILNVKKGSTVKVMTAFDGVHYGNERVPINVWILPANGSERQLLARIDHVAPHELDPSQEPTMLDIVNDGVLIVTLGDGPQSTQARPVKAYARLEQVFVRQPTKALVAEFVAWRKVMLNSTREGGGGQSVFDADTRYGDGGVNAD